MSRRSFYDRPNMLQKPTETTTQSLIYPYQRAAYDRLCAIANAFIRTDFSGLPVNPRGNVFIVGPSGTGKTHLAKVVANSLGLAYLPISVAEWIVMGANQRSAPSTWPTIYQFMQQLSGKVGGIIYLDELDKIGSLKSQGEWIRYQTTEMFFLLDRKFPKNLNDLDGDRLTEEQIAAAEDTLKNKTLVLAGGAFQEIWDSRSIGFVEPETDAQPPDLNLLAQYIPTELSRRFGSQLVFLPRLQQADYHDMLSHILPSLPKGWRGRYKLLAHDGIPEATRLGQGPRYFEELLLEVAIHDHLSVGVGTSPE